MVQFRRSRKIGPFRLTLSNRGLSTSLGAGPLRFSRSSGGRLSRTIRIPGTGLYDTKVISRGHDENRERAKHYVTDQMDDESAAGWYADPRGTGGRAYWDGTDWTLPAVPPPTRHRGLLIAGSILGGFLLLGIIDNIGRTDDQRSSIPTVTATVTATPLRTTVTEAAPTVVSTVTVTAAPPPAAFVQPPEVLPTEPQAPPAYATPDPPSVDLAPQQSSVYYPNCTAARAAGAAPIRAGEPGYRAGLDRDGDGVACE